MSSYAPGGGSDAPQIVTVAKQPDNAATVALLTTAVGYTTTLESLIVAMTISGDAIVGTPAGLLVLEWLDQVGKLLATHAVRIPVQITRPGKWRVSLHAANVHTYQELSHDPHDYQLVTTIADVDHYYETEGMPTVELPANCKLQLSVVGESPGSPTWTWDQLAMRLLYRQASGQQAPLVANEGLLQPSGFGDQ